MDVYFFSLFILAGLAVSDLVVGVSNDAVNFLNSSVGSRVAPRYVIMIIASLGMLAGVTFSSGMMEVARKGIFHPGLFLMPELMTIFLAVMLTDVILLDLFNTFGLPTSTTVSIVFELLGAAVAVSLIKIAHAGDSLSSLANYINSGSALVIISGILLSVVISFVCGALVQFVTRLVFTFNYQRRLKRYGGIWGGISLSAIAYFILIKGAKGASFIAPETIAWIHSNTWTILTASFLFFGTVFQLLMTFTRINILKPIVLVGTFALAMAFAANDLVNFIGVPLAGFSAYSVAHATDGSIATMAALEKPVQSNTYILLIAGLIMAMTLWISKKAQTVTKTEVRLGRQDEGNEYFESSALSRIIVRMVSTQYDAVKKIIPSPVRRWIAVRLDPGGGMPEHSHGEGPPAFDLLRASVNLMVASAVVSFATSQKLPLSTTYVTFMVAMGTSLTDQAWGRESAVYRVTGVLTVIGGWFVTAFIAFTVASIFALIVYFLKFPAVIALLALGILFVWRNSRVHSRLQAETEAIEAFSLKRMTDARRAVKTTFEHLGFFLNTVRSNVNDCFDGLLTEDRQRLKQARKETKKIQKWANIIIANMFKTIYLVHQSDMTSHPRKFSQTIRSLQAIAESHRDIILKAHTHVENNHSGFSPAQKAELIKIQPLLNELLAGAAAVSVGKNENGYESLTTNYLQIEALITEFGRNQVQRIQRNESKTRLSILFYGFLEDSLRIAQQTLDLLALFRDAPQVGHPSPDTMPQS